MNKKSLLSLSLALSVLCTLPAAGSAAYAAESAPETQEELILPESFDLRNVNGNNYVTPVKSQGRWGTCWSFGSIAACESSILYELSKKTGLSPDNFDVDLSELHTVWFGYSHENSGSQNGEGMYFTGDEKLNAVNRGIDMGGFNYNVIFNYAAGIGPVDENLVPYKNKSDYRLFFKLDPQTGKRLRDENGEYVFEIHPADWKWSEDEAFENSGTYGTVGEDWSVSDDLKFNQPYLENAVFLPSPALYLPDEEGNLHYQYNEDATNTLKTMLLSGYAAEISFCADNSRFEALDEGVEPVFISENYAHYTYDEMDTPYFDVEAQQPGFVHANHSVCIVGYDDNYSKENFKKGTSESGNDMTPPADGAWIVKNSWGSVNGEFPNYRDWGVDGSGYFYISYYDKSLESPVCFDFDVENMYPQYFDNQKIEKIIQQYDFLNATNVSALPYETEMKYANVFTAEQDQYLTEISSYFAADFPTNAEYQIYLLNENAKDPTDGKLISKFENQYLTKGLYTEKLPEKQLIRKGEKYSVVITNHDDCLYYATISSDTGKGFMDYINYFSDANVNYYSKTVINPGESYLFSDGVWDDFAEGKSLIETYVLQPQNDAEKQFCLDYYGSDEFAMITDYLAVDNFKIKAIAEPAVNTEITTTTSTTASSTTTTTTSASTTETTTSTSALSSTTTSIATTSVSTAKPAKYSNDELCQWASKYYQDKNGTVPKNVTASVNADGTVSIDLGGIDTYTVDPETGKGTDKKGNAVDLPATGMTSPLSAIVGTGAVLMTLLGGAILSKSGKKDD